MTVAFRVLGAFEVVVDGVDVTPAASKERALLALLVVNRRHVVSVNRIIEELWPTLEVDRARHALQVRVTELRKLLQDKDGASRLRFVAPGYRLDVFPEEVDEHRFTSLVERARNLRKADDVYAAATTFREAIGLWRGEPLAGVALGPSLEADVARLSEARVDALEECIDAELAAGYHQALTFELARLTSDHPFRERLWAQRVLALYRCGQQAEALRACNTVRRRLAGELGVEPGPALRDLERAVLEQRPELDWTPPRTRRRPELGPEEQPPVRYAEAPGGVSIAYQVAGDGPVDLIIIPGFTSHLDVWWAPWSGRLARRLMTFCRVIVFDKRGTGLSDRPPRSGIEHWMEDARVVLDAVGSERPVVLGMSAGGTVAVLFAATYPERTRSLILYGAEPCYLRDDDCSWGRHRAGIPQVVERVRSEWGTGVALDVLCPSAKDDRALWDEYARFQRASASPGAAATYLESLFQMDVRPVLAMVSAPTLVLHATRDLTDPVEAARYVAARIPDAKLVELDSADHLIWLTDALDAMVNEIQDFVQRPMLMEDTARVLATVLCVEAVPGPDRQDVVNQIQRHRGKVVNCDDGLFATFDGPARAIRCAVEIVTGTTGPARAGLHCGECEIVGPDIRGIAVALAQELARHAPDGHVVVTQTVRDLVFGSDITFTDHDCGAFAGLPGRWNSFLVTGT